MKKNGRLHVESSEELWAVSLDDPIEAAREMEKEEDSYGIPDGSTEKFCYHCGEVATVVGTATPIYCEYCSEPYKRSEDAIRLLAHCIDDIWPILSTEERATYKSTMKYLRESNPDFRQFWYEETTKAARNRAMEVANAQRA